VGAQRSLAQAQSALRRIATLVATEARPDQVFEEVTHEAARLLGAPAATIIRFAPDGERVGEILGVWSERRGARMTVADRLPLDGGSVSVRVFETGKAQRVDDYERAGGPLAQTVRELGYVAAVGAPITLAGVLWGALVVNTTPERPLPHDAESRLCDFAELVGQAIDNADAHEKLAASRLRIVQAQDAERRRLERNLHDGAQQRLVSVALQLRLARAGLADDPQAAALVEAAGDELQLALEELRELARGLHPAVLTERGLRPALEVLAMRAPFVVTVEVGPEERLPAPIEAALYYVAAETVTNAAKHAGASGLTIRVTRDDGLVTMELADDGRGGASAREGGGLRGLADRVEALHGRLDLDSPPGGGTRVRAEIPCSSA
jgi:signal transduction histidine kinase